MKALDQLHVVMKTLRNQCPWDKKQTLDSILKHTLEEVYELSDAIKNNHKEEINHELGDLLLHLFFYAEITKDQGWYGLEEIAENLIQRLVTRHPHIYGDSSANDADQVAQNWDKIKASKEDKHLLDGIPKTMPALMQAQLIQKKLSKHGLDWNNTTDIIAKLDEELTELKEALNTNDIDHQKEEFGDVLFSLINLGRKLNFNSEEILHQSNHKFTQRIKTMELLAGIPATEWDSMTESQMDTLWEQAKQHLRKQP